MRKRGFSVLAAIAMGVSLLMAASVTYSQEVKPAIVEALQTGDTVHAISLLESEIEVDKGYHMNYFTLGMIRFNRDQYAEALKDFKLAHEKNEGHEESLYYLGLTFLKLNEADSALVVMELGRKKAKKLRDRFEDGYGQVMLAQGKYQDADRAFRQAIARDSMVAQYHIHLGDANFYQGVPSLATAEFEKALQMDTASKEVFFHWAEACLEMKDYNCAMEKLTVVLTKDSTHAAAWMRAGSIYFKVALSTKGRTDRVARFNETIGAYKRYFELSQAKADSSTVRAYYELALAYVNIGAYTDGAYQEAAKLFDAVLAIPFEPRDIYFNYGKAAWGMREYEKSGDFMLKHLAWLETHANGNGKSNEAELYQILGDDYYYRKPNDFASAINYYKKSLEVDPEQKRVLQNVAVAYHSMKSYRQAIEYYNKRIALGIDSSSASIYKNAGFCALNIANNQGGSEDTEEIDAEPTEPLPADSNVNYYQVAVDLMKKYLETDSKDTKVLLMVGNTYLFQLVDCTNGVKYLEDLLQLEPGNCTGKKSLGYAYFGDKLCTKNYTKALRYFTEAFDCTSKTESGGCSDVDLMLWIAQCYHLRAVESGKTKDEYKADMKAANEWYHRVEKCAPGNAAAKEGIKNTQFEF